MRVPSLSLLVWGVVLFASAGAGRAETPVLKYYVSVAVPSLDRAAELAAAGFDVAGINRTAMTVGLVVTQKDLDRLKSTGWPVTITGSNAPGPAREVLASYTDPQELSTFIDQVVAAHPDLARKIVLKDALWDAQKQYAVLITKDVAAPNERPSFILDAQHHAREVMTPEIAKDMIDYLTSRYATDAQVARWVDNINIYIVPSVNPDGAMYVFTSDSGWRKNRHPACPVDVNRNYPALWGSCNGSSAECDAETTRGGAPASEPETQGLLQLTADVRPFFTLSYHSFSELIMYPYGCSDPDEMAAFDEVGSGLNAILENDAGQTGRYGVGPIWSTIYLVDGGSIDTQYNLYGAYGFTIEVNSQAQGFQPDYATWRNVTVLRQRTAWSYFLDKTLDGPQIRVAVTDARTGLPLQATLGLQEVAFTHGESPRRADAKGRRRFLVHSGATYHVSASFPDYCATTQAVVVGTGPVGLDLALIRPDAPQGVMAAPAGDNAINVAWQATAGAEAYVVLRALNAGGPYTPVGTVPGTETTFHDAGVSGVATYHYVVRGIQGCESVNSIEASASTTGPCTVGPEFAGAVTVDNAATSTCAISLTWPPAAPRCGGAVTYNVYRSASASFAPGPGNLIASGLTGTAFADHGGLVSATPYWYVVRAVDAGNGSDDGNTVAGSASPTGPDVVGTWTDDAGDTGTARMILASPWAVSATGGHAGPHAYATGAYASFKCVTLTTPAITLTNNSNLSFATKYDMQTYFDGGIVEVSSGGPGLDSGTWTPLGVNFPDMLAYEGNACGLPINLQNSVFSHANPSPAYSATPFHAKLGAYSSQVVQIRWRLSSNYVYAPYPAGWWVDDIAVTNAIIPGTCSAGTAPNPKEAGADGAMRASRLAGTAIDVAYAPGCGTLDNAVYWGTGPIVGSPVWTSSACALGNTGHATFDPGDPGPDTQIYFVVVGQNATNEGSYGPGAAGERPEAIGVGACDKPQVLTGTCP